MRVVRFNNEGPANRAEYETDIADIREIVAEYGHTEDTLELYDNSGNLVAVATWPQGSRVYKYSYGGNLDSCPMYRKFIY